MTSAEAHAIFRRYRALPLSEQIASQYALAGIMRWARRRPDGPALDYGAGLGTISAALRVVKPDRWVVAVEKQVEFYRNLSGRGIRLTSLNYALLPYCAPYALAVIDDSADTHDLRSFIARGLQAHAAIIIEGNRPGESGALLGCLSHVRRPHCTATWKPLDRSKGYRVILCDPRWWERAWFLGVRCREAALDTIGRWRGVRPGWRRRDHDDAA